MPAERNKKYTYLKSFNKIIELSSENYNLISFLFLQIKKNLKSYVGYQFL